MIDLTVPTSQKDGQNYREMEKNVEHGMQITSSQTADNCNQVLDERCRLQQGAKGEACYFGAEDSQ
jgi:hypothetical protein